MNNLQGNKEKIGNNKNFNNTKQNNNQSNLANLGGLIF